MGKRIAKRVVVAALVLNVLLLMVWLCGSFYVGGLMAHWDLAWGRYEIEVYGYPTMGARLATLVLPETHGIGVQLGGCMAGTALREYAHGYNAVGLPAIERRFGSQLLRAYGFRSECHVAGTDQRLDDQSIARLNSPEEDARDELRPQVADDFEEQSVSPRACDELPWLLWQADARDRLRACLLDVERFMEIRERDQDELMRYWVGLGEERTMGNAYLAAFEAWARAPGREDRRIASAASRLAYFHNAAALYAEAEPLYHRALAIGERSLGPDHPAVAGRLSNLAMLLQATNRLAEAEPLMRRVVEIFLNFTRATGHPHAHLQTVINNYAALLQAMDLTQAQILAKLNELAAPYGLRLGA